MSNRFPNVAPILPFNGPPIWSGGNEFRLSYIQRRDRGGSPASSSSSIDSSGIVVRYSAAAALTITATKPFLKDGIGMTIDLANNKEKDGPPKYLKNNSPVVVVEETVVSGNASSNNGCVVETMGEVSKQMMNEKNNANNSLSVVSHFSNSGKIDKMSARIKKAELRGATVAPLGIWRKRAWTVKRTVQIWFFLVSVVARLLQLRVLKVMMMRKEARIKKSRTSEYSVEVHNTNTRTLSAEHRELAKFFHDGCLRLGPAFIKIGQLLSTRVDILRVEYIEELRMLQDNVPGFGRNAALAIIEQELGGSVDELFDSFSDSHIAAASLGQVYVAWLNGKKVAVKVQRPGLRDLFLIDFKSISVLASLLDRFDPQMDGMRKDWSSIFAQSERVLYEEIDYTQEARNCEQFGYCFADKTWVKSPSVIWSHTSSKILTMEYVEGIKITDVEKMDALSIDRKIIARRVSECYLEQLIRHGFFQADPHPGNLAVDAESGGRVIFYDFGMMGAVSPHIRRCFVDLIFGIYENDVGVVCDSLERMQVIHKGADRMTLERVARFYLDEFQVTLSSGGKWMNQLNAEEKKRLRRRERYKIGLELFSLRNDIPLSFPASFTFVFRAFTTLDGIGKTLDPNYDLTRIAHPYLRELVDLRDGNAYISVWNTFLKRFGLRKEDFAAIALGPRRVAHIDHIIKQLEQGDLQLRVRAIETERKIERFQAQAKSSQAVTLAILILQTGWMLSKATEVPTWLSVITSRSFILGMGGYYIWGFKNLKMLLSIYGTLQNGWMWGIFFCSAWKAELHVAQLYCAMFGLVAWARGVYFLYLLTHLIRVSFAEEENNIAGLLC